MALALVSGARAGGWSVVTLDSGSALDPASGQAIRPDEPISFGFMVRQHGNTPMAGLTPMITATSRDTGEAVTAQARAEGAVGHYVATLTLPSAGTWAWKIDAFGPIAEMTPIVVAAPAPAPAPAPAAPAAWPVWAALVVAIAAGAGLLIRSRARRPSAA
jgi:hypothetical protein